VVTIEAEAESGAAPVVDGDRAADERAHHAIAHRADELERTFFPGEREEAVRLHAAGGVAERRVQHFDVHRR
jgi:hypothetical protein